MLNLSGHADLTEADLSEHRNFKFLAGEMIALDKNERAPRDIMEATKCYGDMAGA